MNGTVLPPFLTKPSRFDYFERMLLSLFFGALATFLFFFAITPISDPDFWWHLKSGEMMIEQGGLLQSDPFNFTGDGVVSVRELIILKGYWLWQIVAAGLYSLIGFNGIFLLTLVTVGGMFLAVGYQMRRVRIGYLVAAPLLTLGFFLMSNLYPLERPQVFSFLFATILVGLLTGVRDGGRLGWGLPLLMMLWANIHGGFLVGDLILLCFAAGVVLEFRQDLPRMRHLLFWCAVGIFASLLNPNGPLAFIELFSFYGSSLQGGVSEYQSTWSRVQDGSWSVAILWLLIALYGIGVWSARRIFWPELIVSIFLAYISVMYLRNVGFFTLAFLPVTGGYLQQSVRRLTWKMSPLVPIVLLFLCTSFLLWQSFDKWQQRNDGPIKLIYPENAISFLQESGLEGRMFNSYEYGGYLLWRLGPEIKVFIDGRGLEPGVFDDWQKLTTASSAWIDGRREYETLLDKYAVDYMIQPIYRGNGSIQSLMIAVLNKDEWVPIYLDAQVYIFARASSENAGTISHYRIDKSEFKTRLLLIYDYIVRSNQHEVGYQIARAGMLLYLSRYDEAKAQIDAIAAVSPNEKALPSLYQELASLRVKLRR